MPPPPLRIAMLSLHADPGGILGTRWSGGMSVVLAETALELACRGHRVDIFTHRRDPRAPEASTLGPGVRLVRLVAGPSRPTPPLELYARRVELTRALEEYRLRIGLRYDLIHSHYWLSGVVGQTLQPRWQVPHLITFHTLAAVKDATGAAPSEPALRRDRETALTRTASRLLAPTRAEAQALVNLYGAHPDRIGLVPGGVHLGRFRPVSQDLARRRLGLEAGPPVLLFVGRLDPMKGVEGLVDALAQMPPPTPRLLVAGGDGPGSAAWERLAARSASRGLAGRVHPLGPRPHRDLRWLYAAADAVVLPSVYESFGLVLLEALACGIPVVATPVGAAPELLTAAAAGRLANDHTPAALARAIADALGTPRGPEPFNTRRRVRHLAWPRVTARLEAEYRWALGQKAPEP